MDRQIFVSSSNTLPVEDEKTTLSRTIEYRSSYSTRNAVHQSAIGLLLSVAVQLDQARVQRFRRQFSIQKIIPVRCRVDKTCTIRVSGMAKTQPHSELSWIRSGSFSRQVFYLRTFAPVPPTGRYPANRPRGRRREAYAAAGRPILAGAPAFYTEKTL